MTNERRREVSQLVLATQEILDKAQVILSTEQEEFESWSERKQESNAGEESTMAQDAIESSIASLQNAIDELCLAENK